MAINGHSLTTWKQGDRLTADGLNSNFLMLYEMVIDAIAASRMPDPANVALEMKTGRLVERVEALEKMVTLQAHQRNEPQYVPLSYLGSMVKMVNDLRGEVEAAIARANEMHAGLSTDHDDLNTRLRRVEQKPEAAAEEDFSLLVRDCKALALKADRMLAEIVELRHEVQTLREWMSGTAQRVNRVQYAPLGMVGQILQRIQALEEKQC